nr:MAG TPA: hypothetical protein [Caudoviricetes sp.]
MVPKEVAQPPPRRFSPIAAPAKAPRPDPTIVAPPFKAAL